MVRAGTAIVILRRCHGSGSLTLPTLYSDRGCSAQRGLLEFGRSPSMSGFRAMLPVRRTLEPIMNELLISAALAAGIAALVSNFIVPLIQEFAVALKAIDVPGGRKTHEAGVARLGGVGVVVGLLFGTGSLAVLEWVEWGSPLPRQDLEIGRAHV